MHWNKPAADLMKSQMVWISDRQSKYFLNSKGNPKPKQVIKLLQMPVGLKSIVKTYKEKNKITITLKSFKELLSQTKNIGHLKIK